MNFNKVVLMRKILLLLVLLIFIISCSKSFQQNTGKVEVVNLYSYQVLNGEYLRIYGEVQNNLEKPVKYVKVKIDYEKKDGSVASTYPTVYIWHLSPGEKGPFKTSLHDFNKNSKVTAKVFNYTTTKEYYKPLRAKILSITSPKVHKEYTTLKGFVENVGDKSIRNVVHAIATFYNSKGKVVEIGTAPVLSLDPGKTTPIEMVVNTGDERVSNAKIGFAYDIYSQS